jgi:hypothetical protein
MTSGDTVNVRLRLPPPVKAAAAALKDVSIFDDDGYRVSTHDVNAVLNSLVLFGLEKILPFVEKAKEEPAREYKALAEILRFFLDHPDAEKAFPENFPGGSAAHQQLTSEKRDLQEDGEEFGGLDRDEDIERDMAYARRQLRDITKAQEAVQSILAEREAERAARKAADAERRTRWAVEEGADEPEQLDLDNVLPLPAR